MRLTEPQSSRPPHLLSEPFHEYYMHVLRLEWYKHRQNAISWNHWYQVYKFVLFRCCKLPRASVRLLAAHATECDIHARTSKSMYLSDRLFNRPIYFPSINTTFKASTNSSLSVKNKKSKYVNHVK